MLDQRTFDYLESVVTKDQLDVFIKTHDLIEKLGFDSLTIDIQPVLDTADEHDHQTNVLDIRSTLSKYQTYILEEMGVMVTDDLGMDETTDIIAALDNVGNYGDPQALAHAVEQPDEDLDQLCDVIDIIRGCREGLSEEQIIYVNPTTMVRARQLIAGQLPDEEERQDLTLYRDRFYTFNRLFSDDWVHEKIQQGQPLGRALEHNVDYYTEALSESLDNQSVFVTRLLGLMTISDIAMGDFHKQGEVYIDQFIEDVGQKSLCLTNWYRTLGQFQKEMTS